VKKAILVIFVALLAVAMLATPVFAKPASTTYGNAYGMNYAQTTGKLGGADYVIYMPEDWNGRLIIGCSGYNYLGDPHRELSFGALAQWLVSEGYAFASTNYNGGERAWLVEEGIIRTHQLTEYIVDNYQVTDKIFIFGVSMGGSIALNLAKKYPNLYNGVLDICGSKDSIAGYYYAQVWATKTVAELRVIFSIPAVVPDSQMVFLKTFFATVLADTIEAAGGTPEKKPQAYERHDAVCHADIEIPTISLVGALDMLVPLSRHLAFQTAIAAAGCSDLYRLYIVPNGGHFDAPIQSQMIGKLMELIAWSDSLD